MNTFKKINKIIISFFILLILPINSNFSYAAGISSADSEAYLYKTAKKLIYKAKKL